MRLLPATLLGAVLSQTAIAASHTVTLREYGFGRTSCAADIAQVAQEFSRAAGAVILSSGCVAADIGRINATGTFTYAAAQRVETTTSDVRESWGIDGYYRSPEACLAALNEERQVFTRLTGLAPYVGYCYKANSVSAPRYRVRLDAVGTSSVNKYSNSASWSYAADDGEQLLSDVTHMLESDGAEVVAGGVGRDIGGHVVSVDYYANEEIHLHSQELLFWQRSDDCRAAASDLNQTWDPGFARSIFHCSVSSTGTSRLLQIYASADVLSGFDFDTETYATDYPTATGCKSETLRIRNALSQSGTQVLGMVCGQSQAMDAWNMAVFSHDINP